MDEKSYLDKIAELENKLRDQENEHAQQVAQLVEEMSQGKKPIVKVPGVVEVRLETPEGKKVKKKVQIKDGHPYIPVEKGSRQVVSTISLMKVAQGQELSEEEKKKYPKLLQWGKEGTLNFITSLVARGSGYFKEVTMILLLLFSFSFQTDAQIRSGRIYEFNLDTLTNTDTTYFNISKQINDLQEYEYTYQMVGTNISGTTAITAYIQESMFSGDWVNVDTISITGNYNNFIEGQLKGFYQRIIFLSSGAHATAIKGKVRVRRKYPFKP